MSIGVRLRADDEAAERGERHPRADQVCRTGSGAAAREHADDALACQDRAAAHAGHPVGDAHEEGFALPEEFAVAMQVDAGEQHQHAFPHAVAEDVQRIAELRVRGRQSQGVGRWTAHQCEVDAGVYREERRRRTVEAHCAMFRAVRGGDPFARADGPRGAGAAFGRVQGTHGRGDVAGTEGGARRCGGEGRTEKSGVLEWHQSGARKERGSKGATA